MQTQYG